ncbi:MAG: hypothetical protein E7555_09150 [Ruminococcaceae bacterium]|nr:hypothetical protein [Oscillospiraceae bacterium]
MDNNNPHKGHRKRVKEKIIAGGLSSFQPHEVLEFLLFYSIPRIDTNPIAHKLISVFGSLENVLDASVDELMSKGGLSLDSAVLISSLRDVFYHYEKAKNTKKSINSTAEMVELFRPFVVTQTSERLIVAFFDSGLRLKSIKEFGNGQENGLRFNAKDILREAISFNAYSVAIAHNHPVSTRLPSKEDINTTSDIKNQLEYFDIKLIEHIIFGTDGAFSFAADEQASCFISSDGNQR